MQRRWHTQKETVLTGSSAFHTVQKLPRELQPFSCLRFLVLYLWQKTLVSHLIFSLPVSYGKNCWLLTELSVSRALSVAAWLSSHERRLNRDECVLFSYHCHAAKGRTNSPWYRFRHSEIRLVGSGSLWNASL